VVSDEHGRNVLTSETISASSGSQPERCLLDKARSEREDRVRLPVLSVSEDVLNSALKLFVCSVFLLPCEFRLFSRLGAVAMVVPFFMVPCTLLLLPSLIVVLGPDRREADLAILYARFAELLKWIWT